MRAQVSSVAIILFSVLALLATSVSASDDVPYRRTVVVSPGDSPEASGTALLNAMDAITDASASNPYLLKIEPGIYSTGVDPLRMKSYVDVEGSGEKATTITSGGMGVSHGGTIIGAANAELRFLTVLNSGGNLQYATAIYNNAASPKITHVTAIANGAIENYAIANFNGSAPVMTDVEAIAKGLRAAENVMTEGSNSMAVYNYGASPTMTNVIATATGTSNNTGVFNLFSASPTMVNVTAYAGGSNIRNTAVYNYTQCNPIIRNSSLTAAGGDGVNVGLRNDLSSPVVMGSLISASGVKSIGVENISVGTLKLSNCQVSGGTNSIRNDSPYATYIAFTLLDGGPIDSHGRLTCAGIYDSNFKPLGGPGCTAPPVQ